MLAGRRAATTDRKDGGFSLVEVLVVIVILGILAAIAIPVFLHETSKGYEAGLKTDLRTVANEVQSQNTTNGDYTKTTWKTAGTAAVPNATISGVGQVVGDSTSVGFSPGNIITWIGSTQTSFCIKASNPRATTDWYYSPANGISTTACTS